MRENRLRTLWKSGRTAVNGWLAIPNSSSAETMAHQGWDSLTIDLQHGMVDYQAMVPMLQAISTTNTVLVVRVPWLEPGMLIKTLDADAYGVIAPWSTPAKTPKNWSPTPTAHGVVAGSYIRWYNEKRIKISLGSLSPIEYRVSLGLAA